MNCCGGPAADGGATVQEDFEQAYHPEVVNLQTGDAGGPLLQGLSQVLEEGEIDMDVECRSLQVEKRSSTPRKLWRTAAKCSSPFFKPKSRRLLEQTSPRKKVENFSYCLTKAFFQ